MTTASGRTPDGPAGRLAALGLTLPPVTAPLAAYVPVVRHAGLAYTSGQLPFVDGRLASTGLVGGQVTPDVAYGLARTCALNALAALAAELGSIDAVERIVKVVGYVASAPGFHGQPGVVNGASEFLLDVFGEQGRHARSAVGVAALPADAPVEVEFIVSVH